MDILWIRKKEMKTALGFGILLALILGGLVMGVPFPVFGREPALQWISPSQQEEVAKALVGSKGASLTSRIEAGVRQAAFFWREEDGSPEEFASFCQERFIVDPELLKRLVKLTGQSLQVVTSHFEAIRLELQDVNTSEPFDDLPGYDLFAAFNVFTHLFEDCFRQKIAFLLLLNIPRTSLTERLEEGPRWDEDTWATTRLVDMFVSRFPPGCLESFTKVNIAAQEYIAGFQLFPGMFLDEKGNHLFPSDLTLSTHWGMRDEIKAQYSRPDGLARQELLFKAMERIVDGSIPRDVIGNPDTIWDPNANKTFGSGTLPLEVLPADSDGSRRFEFLKKSFEGMREMDPFNIAGKTNLDVLFEFDLQIPEKRVIEILESVAGSPLALRVARVISRRLGRPLRPFDIWYQGFRPGRNTPETDFDKRLARLFPDVGSFQKAIPGLLVQLGFTRRQAAFLGKAIRVESTGGWAIAFAPPSPGSQARLRTRFTPDGMDFKGFDAAIHELGHNVEQIFTTYLNKRYCFRFLPNMAFSEAFAFFLQERVPDLLGAPPPTRRDTAARTLDTFWNIWESCGAALVEIELWRWMHEHPESDVESIRKAAMEIARSVWNRYFQPVIGESDVPIFLIYSHFLNNPLYFPNYPLGNLIRFQIGRYLMGRKPGPEIERMCQIGMVTPRLWMERAVGSDVSSAPLLEATAEALERFEEP